VFALVSIVCAGPLAAEVNVWQSVGPEGGTILQFAAHPSDPATVYAVAEPSTIYQSSDAGTSWRLQGRVGEESDTVRAIAIDPQTPSTLYAALDHRVFRSLDEGRTWIERGESATGYALQTLVAVSGSSPALVALSDWRSLTIQRSLDGGASWSVVALADDEIPLALALAGSTLYVATRRGVFESSDGGATWTDSSSGLTDEEGGQFGPIAAAPSSSTLYVVFADTHGGQHIFRSTNAGRQWVRMGTQLSLEPSTGEVFLAIDGSDPTLLYLLGTASNLARSRLLRSSDGGRSWSVVFDEIGTGLRASSLFAPRAGGADLLLGLMSGGVLRSADMAETFAPSSRGLHAATVEMLATPLRPSPLVYGANWNAVFAGHDQASRWTVRSITAPDPAREPQPIPVLTDLEIDPLDPSRLQGAANWYLVNSSDAATTLSTRFAANCLNPTQIAIAPSAPEIRYMSGGGAGGGGFTLACLELGLFCALRKSTDAGITWSCVESRRLWSASDIAIDPLDPAVVHTAGGVLARTTDGGETWTTTSTEPDLEPTDIAIDPLNPSTVYAGTERKGVWRSVDRGASWQPLAGVAQGLPDAPIANVVPHPLDPRTLYVAYAGRGVYASLDRGATFALLGAGLEPSGVTGAFAIDSQLPSRLYAGTHGASVWRLTHEQPAPCEPSTRTLCLGGGRFEVQVRWRDFKGRTGPGRAVPLTDDSGYFWFFDSENLELMVKALDARAVNDRFWVFYGSLTNVEFQLLVTDTVTGEVNAYFNPEREFASRGDTSAFPRPQDAAVRVAASTTTATGAGSTLAASAPRAAGEPCSPDERTLCLREGRFRVVADWTNFKGGHGGGHSRPLNETTGIFWFFDESNLELAIKILDGRSLNDHFWVFYGALSNVEYRITVEDTTSGAVRTYTNPLHRFASIGDTEAFRGP
jgi:photosystem II stability/assembly factor-like uncharacterized protein